MLLLSLRWSDEDRRKFYRSTLSQYRGTDATILRVSESLAFQDLFGESGNALAAIACIEHSYGQGRQIPFYGHGYYPSHSKISSSASKAILKSAARFPSLLIAIAEESLRSEVGRKIQPVSLIAKNQHWF